MYVYKKKTWSKMIVSDFVSLFNSISFSRMRTTVPKMKNWRRRRRPRYN